MTRIPPPARRLASILATLTVAGLLAAAALVTGCGAGKEPTPSPSPSFSPPSLRPPELVLTPADIAGIRRRVTAGDEPWASAWDVFRGEVVDAAMAGAPQVDPGPYRGGGDVHDAFLHLDTDSRYARDLAIAWAATGDAAYARKARDYLVAWATGSHPTTLNDYASPNTGQLQSWDAFSFAYAYDLTRATGVYSAADADAVDAYFRAFIAALRPALDAIAADDAAADPGRAPYEWTSALTYRMKDRTIGGDFAMAISAALLGLGAMTGDEDTVAWILDDRSDPLRVSEALRHALAPVNDGDGQGTTPAPEVLVLKGSDAGRGGTVDYMTYNARLATLLHDLSGRLGRPLGSGYQALLSASWLYLARFFDPGARPSPDPQDTVDVAACLPRFAPAYRDVRQARLLEVLEAGNRAAYYESQFLGPVTLTHTPLD